MDFIQLQKIYNENQYTFVSNNRYSSYLMGINSIMSKVKDDSLYFKNQMIIDKVVGKAAAMLLIRSQVSYIHTVVLSQSAKEQLDKYHIQYSYDRLTEYIKNRTHTGMCPMEETVLNIDDLEETFQALVNKQKELIKMKG